MLKPALILLFCVILLHCRAQDTSQIFVAKKAAFENNQILGMGILGAWGVGNIIIGTTYGLNNEGYNQQLGFSNTGFNVVNTTLALVALNNIKNIKKIASKAELKQEMHKYQKIFGINALLDIGYIAGGYALQYYSKQSNMQAVGRSLMFQGSFLLIFDTSMFSKLRTVSRGGY